MWNRHRFICTGGDPRPIKFPPPGPFWCTGYRGEDLNQAVVVAYLPEGVGVLSLWPDAIDTDTEQREELTFTDRFPKPSWWDGEQKGLIMKPKPLDDLEMFEVLQAAYPEKFGDDSNDTWDSAQEFADELSGWEDIADLLGRIVMLTMPMKSGLTERLSHCLGKIEIKEGVAQMTAAVRRDVLID